MGFPERIIDSCQSSSQGYTLLFAPCREKSCITIMGAGRRLFCSSFPLRCTICTTLCQSHIQTSYIPLSHLFSLTRQIYGQWTKCASIISVSTLFLVPSGKLSRTRISLEYQKNVRTLGGLDDRLYCIYMYSFVYK